jgi:HEAT repeat protein
MRKRGWLGWLMIVGVAVGAPGAWSDEAMSLEAFLAGVRSEDANARRETFEKAGPLGAPAIAPLAELIAAGYREGATTRERDVAKAAATALDVIAHYASRPESGEERMAVSRELVKRLGPNTAEAVRIQALDLIGSTADDDVIPELAAMLRDPQMRERARAALERAACPAANQALLSAVPSASVDFRRDLILTLGVKRAKEALDVLLEEARGSDPRIQMAALGALAEIGDARAREPMVAVIMAMEGPARRMAVDRFLRLGDRLAKTEPEEAMSIYRAVLQRSRIDATRVAALIGIGRIGRSETFPIVLESVGDASAKVSNAAAQALTDMQGDDVNQRLVEAAAQAKPGAKAMLLRVLADRQAPQAKPLLQQAAKDESAEVRVTALALLGGLDDPTLEPTLLEAAEKGSEPVRPVALAGYLKLANRRAAENKEQALAMYNRALELATTNEARRQALAGIGAIASSDSLAKVEPLLEDRGVQAEAADAYINIVAAMGKAGRKEDAIKRLTLVVEETRSPAAATRAIRVLRELGADTSGFAAKAGFLTHWWLLGPLPLDAPPLDPAAAIDVKQPVKIGDKSYEWKEYWTDDPQGVVNLNEALKGGDNVAAYAFTPFTALRERDVNLLIGSDDGVIAWLNGAKVHDNAGATRGVEVDQDTAKAKVVLGDNRLLLKVTQGAGDWGFVVRVANTQSRPLDLTRWGEGKD